jgi:hypothetical protein
MLYKAKAAVCSDIRAKHSTQSEDHVEFLNVNPLAPNDIYIYIYMSYRTANLQTLHFKYLLNKYTYGVWERCAQGFGGET